MRIRPESFLSIGEKIADIKEGKLVPANFQRPYVWTEEDVEKLWHSLLMRWPLGGFLFWEPAPDTSLTRLGRGRLGPFLVSPTQHPTLILDGQNRLATLAWSLASEEQKADVLAMDESGEAEIPEHEKRIWLSGKTLVADPETRSIRFVDAAEAETGLRYPLSQCFSNQMRHLRNRGNDIPDDDLVWLTDAVGDSLREVRYTVTTLERATPAEALDAFRHIARVGVPMSDADFAAAMAFALEDEDLPQNATMRG